MDASKELYISHSQWKEEKEIKKPPPSTGSGYGMAIYEYIENINNGKKASSLDLDIHLLMNRLI